MSLPLHSWGLIFVGSCFMFVLWRWLKRLRVGDYRQPTIDELKMLFGFLLLVIVAFLCASIALGNVREESSFGLVQMITVLSALGGGFATWAFSARTDPKEEALDRSYREAKDEWLKNRESYMEWLKYHQDPSKGAEQP